MSKKGRRARNLLIDARNSIGQISLNPDDDAPILILICEAFNKIEEAITLLDERRTADDAEPEAATGEPK